MEARLAIFDAVVVVAAVRGDVAHVRRVVERAERGHAAPPRAKHPVLEALLGVSDVAIDFFSLF